MNLTLGLGIFAIIFGVVMFFLRVSRLETFGESVTLKEKFGKKNLFSVYLVAYSIAPMVFGIILVIMGLRGYSLL